MELLYFVTLTFITAVSIYANFHGRTGSFKMQLCPSLILAVSFYIYSVALPLSRLLIGSGNLVYPPDPDLDNLYMMSHLLAAAGLWAGFALARSKSYYKPAAALIEHKPRYLIRNKLFLVLAFSMVALNVYSLVVSIGGIENILEPYGFNEDFSDVSGMAVVPILNVLQAYFAMTPLVLFFSIPSKRSWRLCGYCLVAVLGALFIVRGHRNLFGMLLLPIVTLYMLRRILRINQLVIGALGVFLFIYTVGIVRNFNLGEMGSVLGSVEAASFDPLRGEFGTNYSVYTKFKDTKLAEDYLYGRTYFVDPVVNIIPRTIWPLRPLTAAQFFSFSFYGGLGKGQGLGFSPVVEAMANFGTWGIFPIFCLTAVFVCWLEKKLLMRGPAGRATYAFLMPVIVNWNRIDMATILKIFLIMTALVFIIEKIVVIKALESKDAAV